ncbi:MAG: type I-U CRISPR-associated protein Cas5/Cas6 [Hyphomicrobiales bacterium]|nr:type I-U CRISPR-associated protein Cas5/Cas6 [Hyphomicrobiales bacterium]
MLVVTMHFLDRFHGRAAGGHREWPPSPLRLYQALIAAAHVGGRRQTWNDRKEDAFRWLERQAAPTIMAPPTRDERPTLYYMPTNDADVLAAAWSRGVDNARMAQKTGIILYPQVVEGDQTVRYLWPLTADDDALAAVIADEARHVVALGHGEDLVVGNGWIGLAPRGPTYVPVLEATGSAIPTPGLLDELRARFPGTQQARVSIAPPLRCIRRLGYELSTDGT